MPENSDSKAESVILSIFQIVDKPVTLFKEKVVDPIQRKNKQEYYHRRFRRVPTIDECHIGDPLCFFEANEQYKRDKGVDGMVLSILRQRRLECETYHGVDAPDYCGRVTEDYEKSATDYFIKYGDLGAAGNVRDAYMKQKHRMIWERRHGPVGSAEPSH